MANWGWMILAAAAGGLIVYLITRPKEQHLLAENRQLTQVIAQRNRYIESLEQRLLNLENVQLQFNDLQLQYNEVIAGIEHLESQETDPKRKQSLRELKARAKRQKLEQEQLAVS